MIILTSFKRLQEYQGVKVKYSVSRVEGLRLKTLNFLFPVDAAGRPIEIEDTTDSYISRISKAYKNRWGQIHQWLRGLSPAVDIVLACECPYSESAERQLQKTGEFVCHTGLIGRMIQKFRPDIEVKMDEDREIGLAKACRPVPHKCMLCALHFEDEQNCSWANYCAGPYQYDESSGRITAKMYMNYI